MPGADRARPLARLPPHGGHPHLPLANTKELQAFVPFLRCIDGGAVAGVPDYRGVDRLASSQKPDRLDLLRPRAYLPATPLRSGLLQLRRGRRFRLALGRVRGLVLGVGWVRWTHPGIRLPDAALPRRPATVQSLADRGIGC